MPESSSRDSAPNDGGEIATSTLAEIYAQQGLLGRALSIYRRMLARAPEDSAIADRIRRLEVRMAEAGPEPRQEPEPASAPPAERERLPWDPPEVETAVTQAGGEAGETSPRDAAPDPAREEATADSPRRVGRMDAQAFRSWLNGR
ncbi:MAG TPA: hypothetical protein VJ982_02665 [Gemmatimonadota bacterium]|nr:hypothetical protein [Gemmatimonadota bacterium]